MEWLSENWGFPLVLAAISIICASRSAWARCRGCTGSSLIVAANALLLKRASIQGLK